MTGDDGERTDFDGVDGNENAQASTEGAYDGSRDGSRLRQRCVLGR